MPRAQTILQVGHSLGLSIPYRLVQRLGLTVGQKVECEIYYEKGEILYRFKDAKQLPLKMGKNYVR